MNRDKITELLRNYRSYKYAIRMYESPRMICAGTASYDDMPRNGSFGSRIPPRNDGISFEDANDYITYKEAVEAVDGALETLTDDEQSVIKLRWMDSLTLEQISRRKFCSRDTIKRIHKRAYNQLSICLRFVREVPQIEKVPVA